jgi:glycosyltransferase involved in cell wall biosynthesis
MKNTKNLYQKYNTQGSLLVISSYPEPGSIYGAKKDALAGFTKNRLLPLSKRLKTQKGKVVVLSDYSNKPNIYQDKNILVIRCYKRNTPLSFIKMLGVISKFTQVKNILIEFEFATFGAIFTTVFFPIFLSLLKALGKNTTIELHQVLTDLSNLSGHIGHTKNSFRTTIFNTGLKLFYKSLLILSNNVLVLEQELKNRLDALLPTNKVAVLPHGVDKQVKRISKKTARYILNISKKDFVVLNFGFVTWYKGTDLLIKAFSQQELKSQKNMQLIVAGGESFNQKDKPHYQKFYQKTKSIALQNKNINITGFVDEKQIPLYFAAADLVVLPYRTFMSSSGPLSLTLSYKKPFILSNPLKEYLKSPDINQAMEKLGLEPQDILFAVNTKAIAQKIKLAKKAHNLKKFKSLATSLSHSRSYNNLSFKQVELIDHKPQPKNFNILLPTFTK